MTIKTKTVWVHAWEYVNGTDAGGGGFDWFPTYDKAWSAYSAANRESGWAHFFFPYQTDEEPAEVTTQAIDGELYECCAKSVERWVSPEVLAYWRANKMQMELA